ncbi:hypothetical protein H2200_013219 [Cladophialophora chaetospira]|uniref:Uncharacterized protein n=1 Tax=Cladophialophora chaetospira TaxID=386627 RepID=A0AA38WWD6_9EURO|nr:hypothetical protein H2200_013219 [Cladophialophora chaetospira]
MGSGRPTGVAMTGITGTGMGPLGLCMSPLDTDMSLHGIVMSFLELLSVNSETTRPIGMAITTAAAICVTQARHRTEAVTDPIPIPIEASRAVNHLGIIRTQDEDMALLLPGLVVDGVHVAGTSLEPFNLAAAIQAVLVDLNDMEESTSVWRGSTCVPFASPWKRSD